MYKKQQRYCDIYILSRVISNVNSRVLISFLVFETTRQILICQFIKEYHKQRQKYIINYLYTYIHILLLTIGFVYSLENPVKQDSFFIYQVINFVKSLHGSSF